jgi:putative transposase
LASTDFFVVATLTFRLLYVFIVLVHQRRRVIHFNVTAPPSSEWTARQIAEAFPWDSAPRYLLHDRDSIYVGRFPDQVKELGMREVLTAPRSPWQSPYVERIIGSHPA